MAAIGDGRPRATRTSCLIRPKGDALALETLFFAEDVRSKAEIEEAVEERGQEAGARPRAPGDREPRRRVRSGGAPQRVPRRPAPDARGEARRRGDRRGRSRSPRRRSSTSWRRSGERRRDEEAPAQRRRRAKGRAEGAPARSRRSSGSQRAWRLDGADRLELRLEERLVDLALVDRDAFLPADLDHFGRGRSPAPSTTPRASGDSPSRLSVGTQKARRALSADGQPTKPLWCPAGIRGPASPNDPSPRTIIGLGDGRKGLERPGFEERFLRRAPAGFATSPPVRASRSPLVHGLGGAAGNWVAPATLLLPRPAAARARTAGPRRLLAASGGALRCRFTLTGPRCCSKRRHHPAAVVAIRWAARSHCAWRSAGRRWCARFVLAGAAGISSATVLPATR